MATSWRTTVASELSHADKLAWAYELVAGVIDDLIEAGRYRDELPAPAVDHIRETLQRAKEALRELQRDMCSECWRTAVDDVLAEAEEEGDGV